MMTSKHDLLAWMSRHGCTALAGSLHDVLPSSRCSSILTWPKLAVLPLQIRLTAAAGCRATGAQALVSLGTPNADELGFAKALTMEEIGGQMVIRLEQDAAHGKVWGQIHCGITVRWPSYHSRLTI